MTSPGQGSDFPEPVSGADEPDEGRRTEQAVDEVLRELDDLQELPVAEHVERFEAVHSVLTDALNRAENLLSGSGG
jgi:hypothetical protein